MPSQTPEQTARPGSAAAIPRLQNLGSVSVRRIIAAAQALELGHVQEAARNLAPVLRTHSSHPEVLRLQAGILSQSGNHGGAIAAIRNAVAQRPHDAVYHNTLGSILGASDDLDGAVVALQRACALQPDLAVAWYNLGVMLTHCVRHDEAIEALRNAVRLNPSHMEARALLSDMLRTQGRVDEAADQFRQMIAERPASGMAWWGLADIKTKRFGEDDIAQLRAALSAPNVGDDDRVPLGFALAKALDDNGRYAEALKALADANAIARRKAPWNAHAFSSSVNAMLDAFSRPTAAAADATLGSQAIFIIGLPRSGTTLVEQILASHSMVEGAGELADLPLTLTLESRRLLTPFPQWASRAGPAQWQALGERYLERTARWRTRRAIAIDKMPSNWMYLGAIRSGLPGARIIASRRDPLETCFSCYRQYLAGNEYARSFEDLAAFWRDYDRSIRFWRERAPGALYEHHYERLIEDPESAIRALLQACGLPFEEACLRFYETKREVRSPSASQVRQPLQRNRARTAEYGALLDPLRVALGYPRFGVSTRNG